MVDSEIIFALNSLRICLESKLLVTNQIVEEFKSSMNSHFASLQHNKLFHGFSSPPSLSQPHGHPPPTNSLHHYTDISPLLKFGFREPIKATPLIYVPPSPPPIPSPNSILIPNSNAAIEIVENDALLDNEETRVVERVFVENDALLDNEETRVVERVFVENVEAEFVKELDMLITTDFNVQFDIVVKEEQVLPIKSNMVTDSFLSKQLIKVVDTFNSRKDDEEFISFPQLVMSILDKGVECIMRCTHHGIIFVAAPRKIILARRRIIFKLYALKEVYIDSFNLHLEDKVVLKGRRVDTTKKREKKY